MRIRDFFSSDFETNESHYIQALRSRYYRCRNNDAMEAVKKLAKEEGGEIKFVDDVHHEVNYETSKYNITATVVSTSYTETAIDFKITTYAIIPCGKGAKIIEKLYARLDKMLPFKGVSLYRNH